MKNVLFAALIGAVAATTTWAQTPESRPASVGTFQFAQAAPPRQPAPPVAPRTATPATPVAPGTAPAPAPPPPVAAPVARGAQAPRNIRFEIFITETGVAKPGTKTVSITVNDSGGNGSVRNIVRAPGDITVSLNVDVRQVQAFETGAVRANINVEYQPYTPDASAPSSGVTATATSMFEDGRRIQILQTTDPLSDRRTSIEVLATVLK